ESRDATCIRSSERSMAKVTYDKQLTALVMIDPYNDFISEGGKLWDRLKGVAEANNCVPHMLQVLNAARKAGLRVFYALHLDTARATTRLGSTLRPFRGRRGRERASNTARGVGRSVPSSSLSQARSSPRWCSSGFANTDLDLQLKNHGIHRLIVVGLIAHTCVEATVRFAAELGYEVTVVKDATADYSDAEMHAALDINMPNYASAIVTAKDVVDSISSL